MISSQTTFSVVNDDTLSAAISSTTHSLVYVAPGITKPVVEAIAARLDSQPNLLCTLIIDLDPEVYRLGYGTEEGLLALQILAARQQLELRQQEGLRIGLLMTDGQTLIYSPTPLLIEAGSASLNKPNAVVISAKSGATAALMSACAANGASSKNTPLPHQAEIGRTPATPEAVNISLQALKSLPPKKFDVARTERVYESKIQFVELEVTGYRLSTKKVSIPNDLLVGEDSMLKERLRNSFTLLKGEQEMIVEIPEFDINLNQLTNDNGQPAMVRWSEAELEKQRKALYTDFLINVPSFGHVIMRNRRSEFDNRISLLTKQIEAYRATIEETIGGMLVDAISNLAKNTLLNRVRANIPARYKKFLSSNNPTDDELLCMIENDLERAFGGVRGMFNPVLSCIFKGVTYESIQDENFKKVLTEAMRKAGGEGVVRHLFREYNAAPEAKDNQKGLFEK